MILEDPGSLEPFLAGRWEGFNPPAIKQKALLALSLGMALLALQDKLVLELSGLGSLLGALSPSGSSFPNAALPHKAGILISFLSLLDFSIPVASFLHPHILIIPADAPSASPYHHHPCNFISAISS